MKSNLDAAERGSYGANNTASSVLKDDRIHRAGISPRVASGIRKAGGLSSFMIKLIDLLLVESTPSMPAKTRRATAVKQQETKQQNDGKRRANHLATKPCYPSTWQHKKFIYK